MPSNSGEKIRDVYIRFQVRLPFSSVFSSAKLSQTSTPEAILEVWNASSMTSRSLAPTLIVVLLSILCLWSFLSLRSLFLSSINYFPFRCFSISAWRASTSFQASLNSSRSILFSGQPRSTWCSTRNAAHSSPKCIPLSTSIPNLFGFRVPFLRPAGILQLTVPLSSLNRQTYIIETSEQYNK